MPNRAKWLAARLMRSGAALAARPDELRCSADALLAVMPRVTLTRPRCNIACMARSRTSSRELPGPAATLASAEARRIALIAQGFGKRPASALRGPAAVHRAIARIGLVQLDSVNALVRSHYLPLFSRCGPYARDLVDRAAYAGPRRGLFEYWGHEASLLPVALHPLLRWRMERARRGEGLWGRLARFGREQRDFIDAVLDQVRTRGPLSASELEQGGRSRGAWWGWSHGKEALEWLFWTGEITTATRRNFERIYDLPARVLPSAILGAPTPPEAQAQRELLLIGARALGVATERDLRDYFRLSAADARARLAELVEAGDLQPVRVEGWKQQAYLHRSIRVPRQVEARALLSPFDSLVWERQRIPCFWPHRSTSASPRALWPNGCRHNGHERLVCELLGE
jgi:uncharacterized protein YcaQ